MAKITNLTRTVVPDPVDAGDAVNLATMQAAIGGGAPDIETLSNVSNGGTIAINADLAAIFRVTTTGAGATLGVPTNPTDGKPINVEVFANVALSLTVHSSIVNCSGVASPVAVGAGKRAFLGLRPVGTTWYLLAVSVQP